VKGRVHSPITVKINKPMERVFETKTSSGKNLKLTVHLNMKTLPMSKEFLRYSRGKVERNGNPRTSCQIAQMERQMAVSYQPVERRRQRRIPGE
jgi:hypothetical protein